MKFLVKVKETLRKIWFVVKHGDNSEVAYRKTEKVEAAHFLAIIHNTSKRMLFLANNIKTANEWAIENPHMVKDVHVNYVFVGATDRTFITDSKLTLNWNTPEPGLINQNHVHSFSSSRDTNKVDNRSPMVVNIDGMIVELIKTKEWSKGVTDAFFIVKNVEIRKLLLNRRVLRLKQDLVSTLRINEADLRDEWENFYANNEEALYADAVEAAKDFESEDKSVLFTKIPEVVEDEGVIEMGQLKKALENEKFVAEFSRLPDYAPVPGFSPDKGLDEYPTIPRTKHVRLRIPEVKPLKVVELSEDQINFLQKPIEEFMLSNPDFEGHVEVSDSEGEIFTADIKNRRIRGKVITNDYELTRLKIEGGFTGPLTITRADKGLLLDKVDESILPTDAEGNKAEMIVWDLSNIKHHHTVTIGDKQLVYEASSAEELERNFKTGNVVSAVSLSTGAPLTDIPKLDIPVEDFSCFSIDVTINQNGDVSANNVLDKHRINPVVQHLDYQYGQEVTETQRSTEDGMIISESLWVLDVLDGIENRFGESIGPTPFTEELEQIRVRLAEKGITRDKLELALTNVDPDSNIAKLIKDKLLSPEDLLGTVGHLDYKVDVDPNILSNPILQAKASSDYIPLDSIERLDEEIASILGDVTEKAAAQALIMDNLKLRSLLSTRRRMRFGISLVLPDKNTFEDLMDECRRIIRWKNNDPRLPGAELRIKHEHLLAPHQPLDDSGINNSPDRTEMMSQGNDDGAVNSSAPDSN